MNLPKAPVSGPWEYVDSLEIGGAPKSRYVTKDLVCVISALETAEGHSGLLVPHWHVSVSQNGKVATTAMMDAVRRDFQMEDAEEDNHGKGIVRHLWREVYGEPKDCHCKNEGPPFVDGEREWRL